MDSRLPPGAFGIRRHAVAGLPEKRFFTHFRSLADVPEAELAALCHRLGLELELELSGNPARLAALAAINRELVARAAAANDE
jgi:hypothetical protein